MNTHKISNLESLKFHKFVQFWSAQSSDTVSPHILYDFYIGNEAAREEAELKEAARWQLS